MRADPQPHLELPQLVAHPINQRMNPEAIERPPIQLVVQAFPIADEEKR